MKNLHKNPKKMAMEIDKAKDEKADKEAEEFDSKIDGTNEKKINDKIFRSEDLEVWERTLPDGDWDSRPATFEELYKAIEEEIIESLK